MAITDDDDFDDEQAWEDDDDPSVDTRPCPYCGKPVYEQAQLCPHCRSYISREDGEAGKPRWIILAAITLIIAIIVAWVLRGR